MSAYSGTLKTNAYKGRYLLFSWWLNSQDRKNNTSTIYWELTGAGTSTEGVSYYKAGSFSVVLNGETVFSNSTSRVNLYDGTTVAMGYFTIQHNSEHSENLGYLDANVEGAIYMEAVNCRGYSYWEMPDMPDAQFAHIVRVEPFNDEEDFTFMYENPIGDQISGIEAVLELGTARIVRAVPVDDSSFTITFNDTERASLRANCANAKTAYPVLFLTSYFDDGDSIADSFTATMEIVNAEPSLIVDIVDINPTTVALTGGGAKMVKGYNTLSYTQSATARKSATIKSYSLTYGNTTTNATSGTIENTEVNSFVFTVTDSRGFTTSKTVTLDMVDYVKPTCNQEVAIELANETGAQVDLKINGRYFNGSFGAQPNTLKIEVKHTDNDGNEGNWVDISALIPEVSDNSYTLTTTISGLRYDIAYTFQCRVTDKLNTALSGVYTAKLMPVFEWDGESFDFNVPVRIQGQEVKPSGASILSDTITAGTVTLNDSISNYSYIEILFTDNNNRGCGVAKFIPPVADNSKTIDLFLVEASSAVMTYIRRTAYICRGTTLTPNVTTANYSQISSVNAYTADATSGTNYIKVVRVLGYK